MPIVFSSFRLHVCVRQLVCYLCIPTTSIVLAARVPDVERSSFGPPAVLGRYRDQSTAPLLSCSLCIASCLGHVEINMEHAWNVHRSSFRSQVPDRTLHRGMKYHSTQVYHSARVNGSRHPLYYTSTVLAGLGVVLATPYSFRWFPVLTAMSGA